MEGISMYCRKCGKQIDDEAVICVHCGVATNPKVNKIEDPLAKSKLVAGLLGILIGSFGIHNFYLGYTQKAIIQLLLTVLGWIVVVGPVIAGIWGLIDGIMILTGKIDRDADGRLLKD
jgi:TM2 domain-containing membrane protein YozV